MEQRVHERMTPEDAAFLYLEKEEMPLHIGSVGVFDGVIPFDHFVKLIESKLDQIPRYRQRAVSPPFNVAHPTWEPDPDFRIRHHIHHRKLAAPGGEKQLQELAGEIYSNQLDRSKPLWDIVLVDGYEGGRSAIVTRIHHSMADGIGGVGLMNVMLDATPHETPPAKTVAYQAPPIPESAELLVQAVSSSLGESMERILGAQATFLNYLQAVTSEQAMRGFENLGKYLPELALPVERLPFNRPCSGQRKFFWTDMMFAEARAIRSMLGGTVNDVVLTVLADAVSRYARTHRQSVKNRFLRIMMPVSLRREEHRGQLGNRVSVLPVNLPLDIADPVERMHAVTERTAAMKHTHVADLIGLMTNLAGTTPAILQSALGALPFLSAPAPLFNMVCTNVPGPQIPLYSCGRELLTLYPHVPVGAEMGVGLAIQSYNQRLYLGLTADVQAAPDAERLVDNLNHSYQELRKAAGVEPIEPALPVSRAAQKKKRPAAKPTRQHRQLNEKEQEGVKEKAREMQPA